MTQYLTTTNFNTSSSKQNTYIVVHYTANDGDTALNNAKYFYDTYRGASAHYFVDENEIVQVVLDKDVAWHCGATSYVHDKCRNSNSIGIEMCSRKDSTGKYYIKDEVLTSTVELVKSLMETYSIPTSNVLRHFDVTGKTCPEPLVSNSLLWDNFLNSLITPLTFSTAKQILIEKLFIATSTVDFLSNYRYGEDLIIKIASSLPITIENSNITDIDIARSTIKSKASLSDTTLDFLYNYKYGDDLLLKIANAL